MFRYLVVIDPVIQSRSVFVSACKGSRLSKNTEGSAYLESMFGISGVEMVAFLKG